MAAMLESKTPAKTIPANTTRMCLKCGRVRKLTQDFYVNKDWKDQDGYDVWCKICINRCATKDEIREYFWENNREWIESIWDGAEKKALKILINNPTYKNSSEQRKNKLLQRATAQQVPNIMNLNYKFVDNSKSKSKNYQEALENGEIEPTVNNAEATYSEFFNGYYTPKDLKYLENYYSKLEEDFTFDNESIRDYARKVCKASLQADKAQDDYATGRCQFSDVKDALTQFDMLSKSANFAACKRKVGESSGLTSWSETTYKLETTGHTMQRQIKWPEDDVDRCIHSLEHIVSSLGLDSL